MAPRTRIGPWFHSRELLVISCCPRICNLPLVRSNQRHCCVSQRYLYMWLQVWVSRSYLLLCVVSMLFPVNHHNFLELINFIFFLAQQCQLWLLLLGGLPSYSAAHPYKTMSIMRKWKKPQKEGSRTSVARASASSCIQLFCSWKEAVKAKTQ